MSYAAIALMKADADLITRVTACAAQERSTRGVTNPPPEMWVSNNMWSFVSRTDWADAYSYALGTGVARPGWDDAVVTDAMILAAVQPLAIAEAGA